MKTSKTKQFLKSQSKSLVKQQQPLPSYLTQQNPIFYATEKYTSDNYFKQNEQVILSDISKCQQFFNAYINGEKQITQKALQLREFTTNQQINFNSGMSFFSCKNMIFNQYLICLKFYELFKLNNSDFTTGQAFKLYQRLIYLKTLILKLSPVEKKLQYQKNKLLKKGQKIKISQFTKRVEDEIPNGEQNKQEISEEQQQNNNKIEQSQKQQNEEDNLSYKPMVKNLLTDKIKTKAKTNSDNKYVAPKLSSVLPAQQKSKRREERQQERRKAFLIRKFRGDIESGDEAVQEDMLQGVDLKMKKKFQQKLRYQQENFTRLNDTKQQKYWKKQMMKNKFKNSMNEDLNQIKMIRELVQQQTQKAKRPRPIKPIKPTKQIKPIKKRKTQ